MTPARRKAEELVERFIPSAKPQYLGFWKPNHNPTKLGAINCALICVEEMLIALEHTHDNTWAENGCFTGTKSYDYWNQVQTELKAMRDEL